MKVFVLLAILAIAAFASAYDPGFLFESIKAKCGEDESCNSEVLKSFVEKAISYDTGDKESSQLKEAGMLLEVLQYKCGGEPGCAGDLLNDVLDDIDEEIYGDEELDNNYGASSDWDDDWDEEDDEMESEFEMYENGENLDSTAINSMYEDECQKNPEECAKYVEKMRREGKLHIGKVSIDSDGNPVVDVPKAVIFEEELKIPKGSDTEAQ